MVTRTVYKGVSKASFKNKKEYSFTKAQEILGFCKRKEIFYTKQEQLLQQYEPIEWTAKEKTQILEKFDVWINERGDMLLAIPLPEKTLNINDFEF